jgi:hypothetical protein
VSGNGNDDDDHEIDDPGTEWEKKDGGQGGENYKSPSTCATPLRRTRGALFRVQTSGLVVG